MRGKVQRGTPRHDDDDKSSAEHRNETHSLGLMAARAGLVLGTFGLHVAYWPGDPADGRLEPREDRSQALGQRS
jgi:hypothetical protein